VFSTRRVPLANVVGGHQRRLACRHIRATCIAPSGWLSGARPQCAIDCVKAAAKTGADSIHGCRSHSRAELAVLTLEAAYLEALEKRAAIDPDNNDKMLVPEGSRGRNNANPF